MASVKLDALDLTILQMLEQDGRLSYQELANHTGVSRVTIHERVRRLTQRGIIEGFHARLNPASLGYRVTAIVGLMAVQGAAAYQTIEDLKAIPEIEEVHVVTGRYDYLVKIRARDNEDLERILLTNIDQVYGFQRAETMVVLSSPVDRGGLTVNRVTKDMEEEKKEAATDEST
ncbi:MULTISPECIES: Lrp/AsnC family transcriptional regulator [Kyrpidia]|uniref:Lrp/AsnC family transcriptional regulator n=1 Tax=Kyrpidia TaxID=1129704 RepID=UPI0018D843CC|nr:MULTISPECIES: Lrp/AsnC family transcriptional regulator [Kyrpidia]MCL6575034.1 Lrp/AsnC family transcriptional regulator [Kyrpidia sp.]